MFKLKQFSKVFLKISPDIELVVFPLESEAVNSEANGYTADMSGYVVIFNNASYTASKNFFELS